MFDFAGDDVKKIKFINASEIANTASLHMIFFKHDQIRYRYD